MNDPRTGERACYTAEARRIELRRTKVETRGIQHIDERGFQFKTDPFADREPLRKGHVEIEERPGMK